MTALRLTSLTLVSLLTVGCATRGGDQPEPPPVEDRTATAGADSGLSAEEIGAEARGAEAADGFVGSELDDPANPLSQRVFYFDYDSSDLTPEAMAALRAHGEFLAADPQRRVVVEGHTDERGSREYNLALGERRAEAVKKVLLLSGATADQIESVSFGEEKPAQMGSDEAAWQQNRRAELLYAQQ